MREREIDREREREREGGRGIGQTDKRDREKERMERCLLTLNKSVLEMGRRKYGGLEAG